MQKELLIGLLPNLATPTGKKGVKLLFFPAATRLRDSMPWSPDRTGRVSRKELGRLTNKSIT
jgi:hypothetical protein